MSDRSLRRPWLAALLALVVSGLGHAYLRQWARALGWYLAVTATVFLFVPESAISGVLAGDPPPIRDLAPAAAVVAASVIDAYVVALRNNREYAGKQDTVRATADSTATDGAVGGADATDEDMMVGGPDATSAGTAGADGTVRCPGCGKETDPTVDFCQWCAEPLGGEDES